MKSPRLRQVEAMRNPMAASLALAVHRPKAERIAKGKGSYQRQPKHRDRDASADRCHPRALSDNVPS